MWKGSVFEAFIQMGMLDSAELALMAMSVCRRQMNRRGEAGMVGNGKFGGAQKAEVA